jgi:hypothetical protein
MLEYGRSVWSAVMFQVLVLIGTIWLWKVVKAGKPNLCLVLSVDWLLVLLSMGFRELEMRLNMQAILIQKSKFWSWSSGRWELRLQGNESFKRPRKTLVSVRAGILMSLFCLKFQLLVCFLMFSCLVDCLFWL